MISEALGLDGLIKQEGYILKSNGYEVIDLGDDIYTQGKPHPMIDPDVRIQKIHEYGTQSKTGIILFDVVLGYGAHEDMAGALLPAIKEELAKAKEEKRTLYFVATVVGTRKDPQNYDETVKRLEDAGIFVAESNAKAVQLALLLKGITISESNKEVIDYKGEKVAVPQASAAVTEILNTKPRIINVGLQSFNESITDYGGKSVQLATKSWWQ